MTKQEKSTLYYNMTRDGFVFLVMGFRGKPAAKFKEEFIHGFNRMEQHIRMMQQNPHFKPPFLNYHYPVLAQKGESSMNRELLEEPFDPAQIRQRQGNFGNVLDYVEGHAVIKRLNDALDGNWSFEVTEHKVLDDIGEVLVLGRLTTNGITKSQFGSSAITRAKQTGEMISLADDLKAAATDALKKCATQLGVGLYLYGNAKRPGSDAPEPRKRNGNGLKPNGNGNRNGNGRLTPKQHSYILRLIGEAGITRSDFDRQCVERFGTAIDYLSRADASQVIGQLASQ